MREFLYLDTDYLESYLAQINEGLETSEQTEYASGKSYTKGTTSKKFSAELNAETGKPISLLAKAQGKLGFELERAPASITDSESGKQLIVKQLGDFMFDEFYLSVEENAPFVTTLENMNPGTFVKYHAQFDYIDFDRISTLYSEENRQIYVAQLGSALPSKFTYDEFEQVRKRIAFFKQTIPFDALMYVDDLLVVLKEKYLRDGKQQIGFKFDGQMTVVGKINKKVPDRRENRSGVIATLNEIQSIAFEMLKELGFISKADLRIVTPIAVYYENVS